MQVTTMESYTDYLGKSPDPSITEASLGALERRMRACVLPREPRTEIELAAIEYATYEQASIQTMVGIMPDDPRLKSFKLGELSMTLEQTGVSREAALFPGGLCENARALLMESGLLYRGVAT